MLRWMGMVIVQAGEAWVQDYWHGRTVTPLNPVRMISKPRHFRHLWDRRHSR